MPGPGAPKPRRPRAARWATLPAGRVRLCSPTSPGTHMNALTALLCLVPPAPQAPPLDNGICRINDVGVLVQVPVVGLRTVDGLVADLRPGNADWYGVYFRDATGPVAAGASGLLPDWAPRT